MKDEKEKNEIEYKDGFYPYTPYSLFGTTEEENEE